MENNIKKLLIKHEKEYLRDYHNQMKALKIVISGLQEEINNLKNNRGSSESQFQRILSERNFYREQSVFLSKTNKSCLNRFKQRFEEMQGDELFHENRVIEFVELFAVGSD